MNFRIHTALLFLAFTTCFLARPSAMVAQDEAGIFQQVDEPPVPLKTPPPKYPDSLRRAGVSGVVAVAIVIDERGAVIDAIVSKSTNVGFEKPSLDALHAWKFKPARVAGEPVKVRVTVPMHFRVQG